MNLTEIVAGILGLIGSVGVAYLAYRRGSKADDSAAENVATAQVYAGYGTLLQRIIDDNTDLRRRLGEAEDRIATLVQAAERGRIAEQRLEAAERQIDVLKGLLERRDA